MYLTCRLDKIEHCAKARFTIDFGREQSIYNADCVFFFVVILIT